MSKRPLPACPAPTGPYVVYPMHFPLSAQPAPTRRLEANAVGDDHRKLADAVDECVTRCATLGLSTPYYAAVSSVGACYCAPGRYMDDGTYVCVCIYSILLSQGSMTSSRPLLHPTLQLAARI